MTGGPQSDSFPQNNRPHQDDRLYQERNGEAGAPVPLRPGAQLGLVVDGSLTNGVEVRLNRQTSVEDLKVGTFVTIKGDRGNFFGVITEIALDSSDQRVKHTPPDVDDPFIAQVVTGTVAFGKISGLAPTWLSPPRWATARPRQRPKPFLPILHEPSPPRNRMSPRFSAVKTSATSG